MLNKARVVFCKKILPLHVLKTHYKNTNFGSINVKDIDQTTYDLSAKQKTKTALSQPQEILNEMNFPAALLNPTNPPI